MMWIWRCGLWLLCVGVSTATFALQASSEQQRLQQLLEQVRQGTYDEQISSQQLEQTKAEQLTVNRQRLQQEQRRHHQLDKQNKQLENELLGLQVQLQQLRQQATQERQTLAGIDKAIQRHERLLRQQVEATGLWRLNTKLVSGLATSDAPHVRLLHLWQAYMEQLALTREPQTNEQAYLLRDGTETYGVVTQYGPFAARAEQGWLQYLADIQQWQVLAKQPALITQPDWGWIDPLLGPNFREIVNQQAWYERFRPAGIVGVLIVLVALFGIGIVWQRGRYLRQYKHRVESYKLQPLSSHSLGGICAALESSNKEQFEATLHDRVMAELPALQKGVGTLAVLAAIAPLLGLLGTVAGMIETFDVVTKVGNSAVELLSEGISKALLTTKLGLITAIPLLLFHSFLKSRSQQLICFLEQSAAAVAVRYYQSPTVAVSASS